MSKTDLNILFIGDSITYGEFINRGRTFPQLLDVSLNKSLAVNVNISALARNGWTTRDALTSPDWSTAMRFKPEIAVIQFGLNDANRWVTDNGVQRVNIFSYKHNLIEMIMRLRAAGTEKIFLMNIHKTKKSEQFNVETFAYNLWLEGVARREKVGLIDVRDRLITEIDLLPDGIHLNRSGHNLYKMVIQLALGNAVKSQDEPDWIKEFNDWQNS